MSDAVYIAMRSTEYVTTRMPYIVRSCFHSLFFAGVLFVLTAGVRRLKMFCGSFFDSQMLSGSAIFM